MAYYLNYDHQSIESPAITSLPNYVKCLMHTGVGDITLDIGDMDKTVFDALIDEIRLYFCKNVYRHIGTYDSNRNWTNPYYFHIPKHDDSVISFKECEDKLEIKRDSMEKVIGLMSRNGIMVNELSGDLSGLRGIDAYERRKEELCGQVEAIKEAYDNI